MRISKLSNREECVKITMTPEEAKILAQAFNWVPLGDGRIFNLWFPSNSIPIEEQRFWLQNYGISIEQWRRFAANVFEAIGRFRR